MYRFYIQPQKAILTENRRSERPVFRCIEKYTATSVSQKIKLLTYRRPVDLFDDGEVHGRP